MGTDEKRSEGLADRRRRDRQSNWRGRDRRRISNWRKTSRAAAEGEQQSEAQVHLGDDPKCGEPKDTPGHGTAGPGGIRGGIVPVHGRIARLNQRRTKVKRSRMMRVIKNNSTGLKVRNGSDQLVFIHTNKNNDLGSDQTHLCNMEFWSPC